MNEMDPVIVLVLTIVSLMIVTTSCQNDSDHLKQLYTDLLSNYDTRIRPRYNQSKTVQLQVLFGPTHVIELETSSQKFTFIAEFRLTWQDEFLKWNSRNYGNIINIKIPNVQIWRPTLLLSKAFDGHLQLNDGAEKILVNSNGDVEWSPKSIYSTICDVTVSFYPFDVQECSVYLEVADERSYEVHLFEQESNLDLTNHLRENSEWEVVSIQSLTLTKAHFMIDYIHYRFTLKRRFKHIVYTTVVPLVLLSFMNVGIYLIPVQSGEKGSIASTVFLAYGVFVSAISGTLPANSLTPSYLIIYICILLVFSVFTVFYSIIQSQIYAYHCDEPVQIHALIKNMCRESKVSTHAAESNDPDDDEDSVRQIENEGPSSEKITAGKKITWGEFLRKCDWIIFAVFLSANVIVTSVCFVLITGND